MRNTSAYFVICCFSLFCTSMLEGSGPIAPPPEAEYENLLRFYLDRRKEARWAPMQFPMLQVDPSAPMPVPFPAEGMLPPPGLAYFIIGAEGAGIWSAIFAKSLNDYGGHLWVEAYYSNGDRKAAAHNGGGFSESDLGAAGAKIVRQAYLLPEDQVKQALAMVETFARSETYNAWCHNCGDAVETATKSLGIQLPSFRTPSGTTAPEWAYRYLLSSPHTFKESRLVDSWNNITNPSPELRQQILEIWLTDDPVFPSLFYPSEYHQSNPSILNAVQDPFPSLLNQSHYGGIALNKRADLKISSSEITGAVFDSLTGQFILLGRKKFKLPEMRIDDVAVAVKSIYGLGGMNPADPAVSIDPSGSDTMIVTYYGQTYGTEFGLRLFQADATLKGLVLGTLESHVPGYLPLSKRFEKKRYLPKSNSIWRTWIVPDKISLIESESKDSIIVNQIRMKCLAETPEDSGFIYLQQFADHFTSWYDSFAVEYPVFLEIKRLAQVTGTIKWLQENQIPIDLSYFDSYSCISCDTPLSVQSTSKHFAWLWAGEIHHGYLSGGVHLKSDLTRITDKTAEDQKQDVLSSKPDECSLSWDLPNGELAETCAILKTKKAGNLHLDFVDLCYPSIEDPPLCFTRYYDSFNDTDCGMGIGWSFTAAKLEISSQHFWVSEVGKKAPLWVLLKTREGEQVFFLKKFFSQGILGFASKNGTSFLFLHPDLQWDLIINHEAMSFNSTGNLTRFIDKNGGKISYHYVGDLLHSIRDSNSQSIDLFYNQKQLMCIKGPDGKMIHYSYNEKMELEYSGPNSEQMRYEYDENHRLSGIFDAGDFFIFKGMYDDFNRLIQEKWGPIEATNEYDLKEQRITRTLRVDTGMVQSMGKY